MDRILDILNDGNLCYLMLLIGILASIGQRVAAAQPRLHLLGLRLAFAAFLAYCAYAAVRFSPRSAEEFVGIALRGLLAAGLALGLSWTLLPAAAFVYCYTLGPFFGKVGEWSRAAFRSAAERRARCKEEEQKRLGQEEYQRLEQERERNRPLEEARARANAEAQRRRQDARVACEVLYNLHAPEIGTRFPRELFHEFLARHLGDNHPPEYVEERSRQLQEIIRAHLERVEPPKKKRTVEELAAWYATMRETIERQPIDDRQKRVQLAQLNLRYRDLVNDVMETLEP